MVRRSRTQQVPHVPNEWPEPWLEPRVLVEEADEVGRWATVRLLERSGFEVGECPGPDAARGWECPIPRGEACPLVEGADAIVFSLSLGSEENRAILGTHRQSLLERPVCVEATEPEASGNRHLLEGCRVVSPGGLGDLVSEVVSALKDRPMDD